MTMKVKPKEPRMPPPVQEVRRVKDQQTKYSDAGHELMDPTPIAPPIGYKKSPSISEQIRTMIRGERLRQEAEAAGYETFEEADDFNVGDDFDPKSPYEEVFEPVPQDDGSGRLKELGDYIGERIVSSLGGDASSPAPSTEAASAESQPGTSAGRREPPPSSTKEGSPGARGVNPKTAGASGTTSPPARGKS